MKPEAEKTLENLLNECRRCKAAAQTAKPNLSGKRTEAKREVLSDPVSFATFFRVF